MIKTELTTSYIDENTKLKRLVCECVQFKESYREGISDQLMFHCKMTPDYTKFEEILSEFLDDNVKIVRVGKL